MNNNMLIGDTEIYNAAIRMLRSICGDEAEFRAGQYEAIEATLTHKRTLVIQRIGKMVEKY